MALAKCKECGHEVSTKAKKCPNCGEPRTPETTRAAKGCLVGILLIVAVLMLGLFDETDVALDDPIVSVPAVEYGRMVAETEFGEEWPFTVHSGTLACRPQTNGLPLALFRANGKLYGLSGMSQDHGYARVDPIWRDHPSGGFKISIGPMVQLALEVCR